ALMLDMSCSVVPPAQVGIRTALDLSAFNRPNVRYAIRQSRRVSPLSSLKSPREANCNCWPNEDAANTTMHTNSFMVQNHTRSLVELVGIEPTTSSLRTMLS